MALRDLDQMVKLRCGERAVVKAPAAGRRDLLVRLLGARTAAVRYAALRALTTDGAGVELAERCLLDRSAFVRGLAQARLIDADIDPAGVYRQGLASPSAALPRALIGLAETAGRDAASLVAGYLADEREGIRKAAARAVVALDSGEATRLLEPMLADPAPGVVKVVVRLLAQRAGALDPDRLADRSRAPHPLHVRLGALRLRQALRGWQRLHADLEAAADPDPDLRAAGIADLGNWLRLAAPTTYTRPSLAERDQLLSLIDRVEPALPAGMARQLRFYVH
jgi:hypothetical protein